MKFSILAWRLLWDRLPTKNNLFRRGIIQADNIGCVAGCELEESVSHLFLHCKIFGSLWQHVRCWIGISGADPHNIHDHFIQFIHSIGHSRTGRSFLQFGLNATTSYLITSKLPCYKFWKRLNISLIGG